jgi:PST family polysaccharide transporter
MILNAIGGQHFALLQRHLRYITVAIIETVALLASVAVGIGMALAGFGYWSLVGAALISPVISTVISWTATSWVPGMPNWKSGIGSMLHFGGTITLNTLVVHIAYNFEKLLLGRYWGADALGIYGRAGQLINIPTSQLNSAVGGVAFAALSRLQDDPNRLRNYFLKGYSLVVSLTVPITMFFALFAEDIILVVLGPKWMAAATVFRLLTPTVLIFGIINPLSWFAFSIGLHVRSLAIALVIAPLVITAYFIGLPYGPDGVAFAYSAAMTLWLVPHIYWCLYRTIISPGDLFRAIVRPFVSGIVAAGICYAAHYYVGQLQWPLVRLFLAGAIMGGVYLGMLMFVMGQKDFYLDLLKGLKSTPHST